MPRELAGLGLPAAVLASHRGFDPGALPLARALADACGVRLHAGRWSRLVADLNRSSDHPKVIARSVDGTWIPANRRLTAAERAARLARFWQPYRDAVAADAAAKVRRGGCLHLSMHSFVERLGGVERRNDMGLLFDPARPRERAFAETLRAGLVARGLSVRLNFPYFGDTDGLVTWLRGCHPATRYRGFEIELNQRLARTAAGQRRLRQAVVPAVVAAVETAADHR